MDKALPVVIICGVGMALCVGYLVFVLVKALRRKFCGGRKFNQFEIDEESLTIKLGKKKK